MVLLPWVKNTFGVEYWSANMCKKTRLHNFANYSEKYEMKWVRWLSQQNWSTGYHDTSLLIKYCIVQWMFFVFVFLRIIGHSTTEGMSKEEERKPKLWEEFGVLPCIYLMASNFRSAFHYFYFRLMNRFSTWQFTYFSLWMVQLVFCSVMKWLQSILVVLSFMRSEGTCT